MRQKRGLLTTRLDIFFAGNPYKAPVPLKTYVGAVHFLKRPAFRRRQYRQ